MISRIVQCLKAKIHILKLLGPDGDKIKITGQGLEKSDHKLQRRKSWPLLVLSFPAVGISSKINCSCYWGMGSPSWFGHMFILFIYLKKWMKEKAGKEVVKIILGYQCTNPWMLKCRSIWEQWIKVLTLVAVFNST